jgi:hypothetical protein
MLESFKCFNVNFRLHNIIKKIHLLVYIINKLQNARCNDKDVRKKTASNQLYRLRTKNNGDGKIWRLCLAKLDHVSVKILERTCLIEFYNC